jgi:carboxymethylenebutenolidase
LLFASLERHFECSSKDFKSEAMMKDLQENTLTFSSERARKLLPNADFTVFAVRPKDPAKVRGGIILIQEIFGVNHHIRTLAKHYASLGYAVWAPAYFDHVEQGVELTYDKSSFPKGLNIVQTLTWDQALEDTKITAAELKKTLPSAHNKVAAIGFCWGGSVTWLAACRLNGSIDAGVSFYGRQTWETRHEKPQVPVIMHFGEHDHSIPLKNIEDFKEAQKTIPVYVYDAGHGFNCSERADFNAIAAKLAEERSFKFLRDNGF